MRGTGGMGKWSTEGMSQLISAEGMGQWSTGSIGQCSTEGMN